MKTRTKVGIAALAALAVALSATAVSAAQATDTTLEVGDTAAKRVVVATSSVAKSGVAKSGSLETMKSGLSVVRSADEAGDSFVLDDMCLDLHEDDFFFDEELSQEEIDEINAEGASLAAAFDVAGISYEMVTEDVGITYPEWDWEDDAANEVADEFYSDLYGDDEWFDEELPQEVIDDINAEGAALAAAFDAAGISYEMVTEDVGISYPEWDWEDDAANEIADGFYEDLYGDEEWFDEELPQEVIDEINAEGAALAEALNAAGISYEMVTDEMGVTYPEWDWEDPAAEAVVDEFFTDLFGDWEDEFIDCFEELPQEFVDEINAEGAALAAAFDAAGVSYEMVTDEMGVTYPEWDWDDPAAEAVVDEFYKDKFGEWEDDFFGEFDFELPEEMIDEINAEGAALTEAFDAAGVEYELVTDESGITYPEWDWDDEAANEIAKEFFGDMVDEFDLDDFNFDLEDFDFDLDLGKVIEDKIDA
ncbi:MAG: hypothetical protein HKN93_03340 [Acidimicrobiia bacterium]|nr:hypothetical protein [Acidimicrobiia bacterium]